MSLTIAFSELFLLVLISLSCTGITNTAPLGPNLSFVERLCSHTPYPKKCNHFLSKRNAEFQNKPQLLAVAALNVSFNEAGIAVINLEKSRRQGGIKNTENEGLLLCINKMDECSRQLITAVIALRDLSVTSKDFALHKNKIDESIKGGLAHLSICIKHFAPPAMNGKVKDSVMFNVTNVGDLIRNSMALINIFAAGKKTKFR